SRASCARLQPGATCRLVGQRESQSLSDAARPPTIAGRGRLAGFQSADSLGRTAHRFARVVRQGGDAGAAREVGATDRLPRITPVRTARRFADHPDAGGPGSTWLPALVAAPANTC